MASRESARGRSPSRPSSRGGKGKPKSSRSSSGKRTKSTGNPMTKTELVHALSDHVQCERKTAAEFLEALEEITFKQLKHVGAASPLPGLLKIAVVDKPARKSRQGINPRTGETITIAAKPASKSVKVRALKRLKDVI